MESTWAKAPDFAGQPARVEAIAAQTEVDKHNYLDSGLRSVECRTCGTCVLVRKNSMKHTSIQWTSDPATSCPTFKDWAAGGNDPALQDGCPKLQNSIEHAVLEGLLDVRDQLPE